MTTINNEISSSTNKILEVTSRFDTTHKEILQEQKLWLDIYSSLNEITTMLNSWGNLISNVSKRPDKNTIKEVAENIDRVEITLIKLSKWLNGYNKIYWLELNQGILIALNDYWKPEIKSSLSLYLQWLSDRARKSSNEDIRWYEIQRLKAGEGIVKFANALESALQSAELYLPWQKS